MNVFVQTADSNRQQERANKKKRGMTWGTNLQKAILKK